MTNQVNTARVVRAGATVPEVCAHNVKLGQGCFCPHCPTAVADEIERHGDARRTAQFWKDEKWACEREIEKLRTELRACRHHLVELIANPDRPTIKAAADWIANWDGERVDPGSSSEPETKR